MFNRLPGAMLKERHMHECKMGHNCGRALLQDTAAGAESYRLFNPAPAGGQADWWSAGDSVTARGPTPYWRTAMCADCVPTPSGESAQFRARSLSGVASGCHQQLPFDNPLVEVEFE